MKETIVAKGKIFELVQTEQEDGRIFEVARRAPGVRLIIADKRQKKILLTKEFRRELNAWDYRLPGGKVFDTLDEYETHRVSGADMMKAAIDKGIEEGEQEAGIAIRALTFYKKSTLGATVEWDLYVMEASDWAEAKSGQQLEAGEAIEADTWLTYDEAKRMILAGDMQEERVALILLQWITKEEAFHEV